MQTQDNVSFVYNLRLQLWFQLESFVYTHMDFWGLLPTSIMCTVFIVIWTPGARFSSVAGECKSNLFWFWHPHYQCKEQSRLNSMKLNPWKYQIILVRSLYKVRDYISHNDLCSESNTLYLSEFLQKGIQSSSHVSKNGHPPSHSNITFFNCHQSSLLKRIPHFSFECI